MRYGESVVAIVLAGGRGERMGFFCHNRAKPDLPFAGIFRVIDFTLSNVVHSQIPNLIILVDYQRHKMNDYLERWHLTNSHIKQFQVLMPEHGSYSGTANAVYQNLEVIEHLKGDTVIILAADHIYKMDYRMMLNYHKKKQADVTIGVVTVPIEIAYRFGIVGVDDDNRILSFIEKPRIPQSNLVSMGIYVFNKQVLIDRLVKDADESNSPHDFGRAIIPGMIEKYNVYAYPFSGYWQDIGTMESYYAANMQSAGIHPAFSLDGRWPVMTEAFHGRPAQIFESGTAENSIVSPGCVIKGYVRNSVLSQGVVINDRASVNNSILLPNVTVGCYSEIESCILDESVSIGDHCHIGFGQTLVPGDWDITLIGLKAVVPPNTYIGRNCRVLPGVDIIDFPTKMVPSGTTISSKSKKD